MAKQPKKLPQDCRTCAFAQVGDLTPSGRWGQDTTAICTWQPPQIEPCLMPRWCKAIEVKTVRADNSMWRYTPERFDLEELAEFVACPTWKEKPCC